MKKVLAVLMFIFTFNILLFADNVKYVFLIIGDGMGIPSEIALSRFLYGRDKKLFWNSFPIQALVTTWSISAYQGQYDKNNFDAEKGYNTKIAGLVPYPYYESKEAEEYFMFSNYTDSAAAATALSSGQKAYNGYLSYDKDKNVPIKNIVDKINDTKKYNVALITTDRFYSSTPAGFSSHNISRHNKAEIGKEILTKTKPEIIAGKNELASLKDIAKDNGYYILDLDEVDRPQVFNLAKKKIFIDINKFNVANPQENFSKESFKYSNKSFSDVVLYSTKLLLKKNKPFFALVEVADIDHAGHGNNYNKLLGGMYELNETVTKLYELINSRDTDMSFDNTLIIVTADHSTGMLRFLYYLNKGQLPKTYTINKQNLKVLVNREISFKKHWHTNELVGLYCVGAKSDLFKKYINENNIIDNTSINKVLDSVINEQEK